MVYHDWFHSISINITKLVEWYLAIRTPHTENEVHLIVEVV
mgnify:CR=1 FL=1